MTELLDEFDSEFCHVTFQKEDNVAFLSWKKFCCRDDYRKPALFALSLLQKHPGSNFVFDARCGFEDIKEDVEWRFSYLLPAMAKTDCQFVVFLLNEVNEIEGEMDMWSKEFSKYFTIKQVDSYPDAISFIKTHQN